MQQPALIANCCRHSESPCGAGGEEVAEIVSSFWIVVSVGSRYDSPTDLVLQYCYFC